GEAGRAARDRGRRWRAGEARVVERRAGPDRRRRGIRGRLQRAVRRGRRRPGLILQARAWCRGRRRPEGGGGGSGGGERGGGGGERGGGGGQVWGFAVGGGAVRAGLWAGVQGRLPEAVGEAVPVRGEHGGQERLHPDRVDGAGSGGNDAAGRAAVREAVRRV